MAHVWGGAAAPRAHALTEKEKGLGPCRWPFLCLGPLSTCPRARSSPKFWTQLGQRRAPSSPAGVSPSSGLVRRPTGCRGGGRIRAGFFRVPPTQRRPLSPEHERAGAGALSASPSHPVTARGRVLLYELRAADGNTDSKVGTALLQVAVAAATRAPRWLIAAAPDAPGDGGAELGEGSMSGPFGANSCSGGRCWSQEA